MKSEAEKLIDSLSDVFSLTGAGFEEFYKNCEKGDDPRLSGATGNYARSGATGNYARSGATGDCAQSGATGDCARSGATGDYAQSGATGYYAQSGATGDYAQSGATGDYAQSGATGDYAQSGATGFNARSGATGNYARSICAGENSAASALGYRAMVSGDLGNLLMASEYALKEGKPVPVGGRADIVDGKKLKPNRWYSVEGGEWVEVDNSDGIFGYVLSNRSGVKKIRNDSGEILFVVSDENGNTAHGKTIKEARADLVYKNIAKFEGEVPKSATGKEWVGIYRAITGACSAGVRIFVESKKIDLEKKYTGKQVVKIVEGQYGAEAFKEKAVFEKI